MRSSCRLELCPFICSRFYLILYYTAQWKWVFAVSVKLGPWSGSSACARWPRGWVSGAIAVPGGRPCFLCHRRREGHLSKQWGTPGSGGRVIGLVRSNDFFFFLIIFFNVCSLIFLFWGQILTLEQDKSTPDRKLNLHFIFNFASGFCKWTAKLISKQKFLLNQRPSGKCGSTVCCCAQDCYSEKKPKT